MVFLKESANLFNVKGAIWNIATAKTPKDCLSEFYNDTRDRAPNIAPGIVVGVSELLMGETEIRVKGSNFALKKGNHICHSRFEASEGASYWVVEGTTTLAAMMLVESLLNPEVPNVAKYFSELLQHLPKKDGYFSREQLEQCQTPAALRAMLRLQDAVYFGMKTAAIGGLLKVDAELPSSGELDGYEIYDLSKLWKQNNSTQQTLLKFAINQGKTALLMGPTGTFKTEMAKRAATEANAKLVVVKGRPGMEDRDFFQAIVPTLQGPQVVDGPLTEAFRKAQNHKTVLLLDELLRFEAYYLGALVGALDQYSQQEIEAMGLRVPAQTQEQVATNASSELDPTEASGNEAENENPTSHLNHATDQSDQSSQTEQTEQTEQDQKAERRYYCLSLPSGEKVVTPVDNLAVVATTNLGDDYNQGQQIDAALFGRFNMRIMVNHPSDQMLLEIYQRSSHRYGPLALEIDKYTRQHSYENGGLLKREANVRVGKEFLELLEAQIPPLQALEVTYVAYCSPVDSNGRLDSACHKSMVEDIRPLMQRYGLV